MWVLFEGKKEFSSKDATQPRTALDSLPQTHLDSEISPPTKWWALLRYADAVIYEPLIIQNAAHRLLARFE